MLVTDITPGSSCGANPATPWSFLCQSMMRPTNGEIKVHPASAQAMAWAWLKMRVKLQVIPSFSRISAALIPSHWLSSYRWIWCPWYTRYFSRVETPKGTVLNWTYSSSNLHKNPWLVNSHFLVKLNYATSFLKGGVRVKGQTGIDFSGHVSRNNLGNLCSKVDCQLVLCVKKVGVEQVSLVIRMALTRSYA